MIKIKLKSRKLPYCDTKRSVYVKPLIYGLRKENGKRDKFKTTYSYWFGYYFGEFNITVSKHPN